MTKLFGKLRDGLEDRLRKVCGRINPDRRVIIIAVLFVIFAVVNIWVTLSAILSIGREERRQDAIEITPLDVPGFDLEAEEPTELQLEIEDFFNQHFNSEKDDTANTE